MKRVITLLAAGLIGALIAGMALSWTGIATAQGPTESARAGYGRGVGNQHNGQMGGQMQGAQESLVGMAANELGLSQADLIAKLGSDGRIVDQLTAAGIEPQGFIDRFVAVRATRLDAAVANGRMDRTKADQQLAIARSMATARIYQAYTQLGPGGQGPNADQATGGNCTHTPAGQGRQAGRTQ